MEEVIDILIIVLQTLGRSEGHTPRWIGGGGTPGQGPIAAHVHGRGGNADTGTNHGMTR